LPEDLVPICFTCKRFKGIEPDKGFVCEAYTDSIPVIILASAVDHREPYKGDNGLQYEPLNSDEMIDLDEFKESDHPRGQPENKGQFVEGGGSSSPRSEVFNTKQVIKQAQNYFPNAEEFFGNTAVGVVPPNKMNEIISRAAESIGKKGDNIKVYGTSSPGQILLNPAMAKEHPAFVASVLYHEMVHQSQPHDMPTNTKELDAHTKTAKWAQRKAERYKTDPKAFKAFLKAQQESEKLAAIYSRGGG
jgi:hypothetical protein